MNTSKKLDTFRRIMFGHNGDKVMDRNFYFVRGFKANEGGYRKETNPFANTTEEYYWWECGWDCAEEEKKNQKFINGEYGE